jgi:hypothetical protein
MKALVLLFLTSAWGASAAGDSLSKRFDFLLGNWVGETQESQIGSGSGGYSFEPQLDGRILVRKNHSEYASGAKHDDLMIVYVEENSAPRAIYFDSEGHVIRYNVKFDGPSRVVFESEGPGPRYRLTYWPDGAILNGRFEVAPPGGEFKIYLSWGSKRIARAG